MPSATANSQPLVRPSVVTMSAPRVRENRSATAHALITINKPLSLPGSPADSEHTMVPADAAPSVLRITRSQDVNNGGMCFSSLVLKYESYHGKWGYVRASACSSPHAMSLRNLSLIPGTVEHVCSFNNEYNRISY